MDEAIETLRAREKMPEGVWVCPHKTCDSCWDSVMVDKKPADPQQCSAVRGWDKQKWEWQLANAKKGW
jgi:hypothetical protein